MAIKKIQDRLIQDLEEFHDDFAGGFTKGLNLGVFFDFTLDVKESVPAFRQAFESKAKKQGLGKVETDTWNQDKNWIKAIKKINKDFKKGEFGLPKWNKNSATNPPGVYFYETDKSNSSITFRVFKRGGKAPKGGSDDSVRAIVKEWRNEVWDEWVDINTDLLGAPSEKTKAALGKPVYSASTFPLSHRTQSTTAVSALRKLEGSPPKIDIQGVEFNTHDILKTLKKSLKLTYGQKRSKKAKEAAGYGIEHVIEARVTDPKGNKEKTDILPIKNQIVKDVVNYFNTVEGKKFIEDNGLDLDGSRTDREQITSDVIKKLSLPLTKTGKVDRRFKKVKAFLAEQKGFETAPKHTSVELKPSGKASKRSRGSLSVAAGAQIAAVKKVQDKSKEVNLSKVMLLVNRSLAKTIKRNMGRPALINRTGRFAESAELTSLRPSKAGAVGTYTYQLNPYETFENTGDRQWPAGYNPKPLIANSIRDLALQQLNGKLTLRRV